MFGFTKRRADESATVSAPQTADAVARPKPAGLDRGCPESGALREHWYARPAATVEAFLGALPVSSNADDAWPSRARWQHTLASEALILLDAYPTQTMADVYGETKWDFHRAIYLRGLVAGLGEYIAHHDFYETKGRGREALDPMECQSLADTTPAPRAERKAPRIAPSVTEFILAQKLGLLELAQGLAPDIQRYFLDSFGLDAHRSNVLVSAIGRAQAKLKRKQANKGNTVGNIVGMDSLARLDKKGPHLAERHEVPGSAQQASAQRAASKEEVPGGQSGADVPRAVPATEPPTKAQTTVRTDAGSMGDVLTGRALLACLKQRIAAGEITINDTGSLVHVTPMGPALVIPRAYQVVSEALGEDQRDVERTMNGELFDLPHSSPNVSYRIRRKRRGKAKVTMGVLRHEAVLALFPDGTPEANEDIVIESPEVSQTPA